MAVKIGQIRKSNNGNYLTSLKNNISIGAVSLNDTQFSDTYIQKAGNFLAGHYYYIRLNIARINITDAMGSSGGSVDIDPHYQNIDIKLFNGTTPIQTLETNLIIPPYADQSQQNTYNLESAFMSWCSSAITSAPVDAQSYFEFLNTEYQRKIDNIVETNTTGYRNQYQVIEFVFSPYVAVNRIGFILRRTQYDYNFSARLVKFEGQSEGNDIFKDYLDVCEVENVLDGITADKIGVQSDPGSLIIVNGEGMRIGKSGVLEINCGIPITSLGFAAPEGNIKDFIVDYTYTE